MIRLILTTIALSSIFLPGCAAKPEAQLSEDEAIYEAVFRKMLVKRGGGSSQTYCLSLPGGKYPGTELMKKLADLKMNLKQGAYCNGPAGQPRAEIVDAVTGQRAVRFTISEINRTGENEARVKAGNWASNLDAMDCAYILRREGGKWTLAAEESCAVS
jgi:hypothetical protein